jgi:hypothetical protein|tara:strand:+ start:305 stop:571 length:267 start_codon:yes stop_codon:yes gene_type:complete
MGIIDKIKAKKLARKNRPESAIEANARLYGGTVKPDPFHVDKEGVEYSKKSYMNTFGTNKYTQTAIDKVMDNSSNNSSKRKRKNKIRR